MSIKTIDLQIVGMTCPSCSAAVERLVDTLEGVESRTINHETNNGVFSFDENKVSEEQIIAKINEGHYKVKLENKTIELPIVGMTCPSCSAAVERLVDTLEGIESRIINHETNNGIFTIDPNKVSEQQLIAKINEGHYKVKFENKTITLPIEGMSCPSCSAAVERLVDTLDGIKSRTISHETNNGVFTFDENKVTEEELIAKINEGHYKVVLKNAPAFAFEGVVPACPVCGNKGQLVPNTVFNSNVGKQAREKINTEKDNYICMDADCDVAYYNAENDTVVSKSELKRELWYKTGTEKVIACYCNNIDTDMIKEAVVNHGLTSWDDIVGHYRTKVIEKCETLNPSGYCCRSTFDGMVKKIQEEL